MEGVSELEAAEKDACNLPIVFADMLKNEINAVEEDKLYNGIKRVIKKYSASSKEISAIDEFARVLLGGADLLEVMHISKDEALNPTLISEIAADNSCESGNDDNGLNKN